MKFALFWNILWNYLSNSTQPLVKASCNPLSRQTDISLCPSRNGQFRQYLRWAANFNPQNTQCIPMVKILARLDLAKIFSSLDGH
jgi:hypothetical protein